MKPSIKSLKSIERAISRVIYQPRVLAVLAGTLYFLFGEFGLLGLGAIPHWLGVTIRLTVLLIPALMSAAGADQASRRLAGDHAEISRIIYLVVAIVVVLLALAGALWNRM